MRVIVALLCLALSVQAPAAGQVFTAPPRGAAGVDQDSFLKGIAVGAGLVALGVVLGGVLGRRR